MVLRALPVLVWCLLVTQAACAAEAHSPQQPRDVARVAVEALLANDPETLTSVIDPERRRSGKPPGLALGHPEMTMLEDCRWTGLERFDESEGASPDERVLTAIFASACVADDPWTKPTRNTFDVVLSRSDGRWYVYDFR
jgi:hypothetical protein